MLIRSIRPASALLQTGNPNRSPVPSWPAAPAWRRSRRRICGGCAAVVPTRLGRDGEAWRRACRPSLADSSVARGAQRCAGATASGQHRDARRFRDLENARGRNRQRGRRAAWRQRQLLAATALAAAAERRARAACAIARDRRRASPDRTAPGRGASRSRRKRNSEFSASAKSPPSPMADAAAIAAARSASPAVPASPAPRERCDSRAPSARAGSAASAATVRGWMSCSSRMPFPLASSRLIARS